MAVEKMMKAGSEEIDWKQHFPTYHFKERDIALKEYKFAMRTLEAEERLFLNAANLSMVVGAVLASLVLGSLDKLVENFSPIIPETVIFIFILVLAGGFSALSLLYFADRQKSVVFAARKVIVLRRMLGMSYGSLQLVLPNWRIEGADEPFSVRMFPGWNAYVTYPCYVILFISSALVFFIISSFLKNFQQSGVEISFLPFPFVIMVTVAWFLAFSWIYRRALFDTHEQSILVLTKWIARKIRLGLVGNFEYVIYRARLARYELHRLGIDLSLIKKLLVHIEDKEFYSHSGVSLKGLVRLFQSVLKRKRAGGSTITQQLVRTLFIEDRKKLVRRKIIEIMLALWFDRVTTKIEQIEIYFASVRFEKNVFGIIAAQNYFLGGSKKSLSPAEAFFIVERVSNIRSKLLVEKIDQTLRGVVSINLLSHDDAKHVVYLYANAIDSGKIQDPDGSAIERLKRVWID